MLDKELCPEALQLEAAFELKTFLPQEREGCCAFKKCCKKYKKAGKKRCKSCPER